MSKQLEELKARISRAIDNQFREGDNINTTTETRTLTVLLTASVNKK